MNIKEMSLKSGMSPRMLRHYEELKLLKPGRTVSGYRKYNQDHLEKVSYISSLNNLGLELKEIKLIFSSSSSDSKLIKKLLETYTSKKYELKKIKYQIDDLVDILKSARIKPIQLGDQLLENITIDPVNHGLASANIDTLKLNKICYDLFSTHITEFAKTIPTDVALEVVELKLFKDWHELTPSSLIKSRWSEKLNKPLFLLFPFMGKPEIDDGSEKELDDFNVVETYFSLLVKEWKSHNLSTIDINDKVNSLSKTEELVNHFKDDDLICIVKYKIMPKIGARFFYFVLPFSKDFMN